MFNSPMNNNSLVSQDSGSSSSSSSSEGGRSSESPSLWARVRSMMKARAENNLRDTIEEYIDEPEKSDSGSAVQHERALLSNILDLRDLTVDHVMVPRADILALSVDAARSDILKFFSGVHVSRVPVYRDTLDHVVGTVHIKDILTALADEREIILTDMLTDAPVISPSMPLLDVLLEMRHHRRHMAIVVDEYGGVDGLITVGDVVEAIVGEMEDEHDRDDDPEMIDEKDGAILADARVDLEDFCERYGEIFDEEEMEECDTLGGLVFYVAGRIPARGEVITHETGLEFEIVDADPRRVHRLRIRGLADAKPLSYAAL
jgi:CBS domain containing-hemolysin-like protein